MSECSSFFGSWIQSLSPQHSLWSALGSEQSPSCPGDSLSVRGGAPLTPSAPLKVPLVICYPIWNKWESFKYPTFFSSSKIIPFPQIYIGNTCYQFFYFSGLSTEREKEQARPCCIGGTDPVTQEGCCSAFLWGITHTAALAFPHCSFQYPFFFN